MRETISVFLHFQFCFAQIVFGRFQLGFILGACRDFLCLFLRDLVDQFLVFRFLVDEVAHLRLPVELHQQVALASLAFPLAARRTMVECETCCPASSGARMARDCTASVVPLRRRTSPGTVEADGEGFCRRSAVDPRRPTTERDAQL